MNRNYLNSVQFFLNKYKVQFSDYGLENHFTSNPNNSNFFGLSQLFMTYGLKPSAQNISFNEAKEKSDSFLAYLINPAEIITITKINSLDIELIDEKGNCFKEKISIFLDRWSGNVMFLERDEIIHEKYLFVNKVLGFIISEKKYLFVLLLLLSFFSMLVKDGNYVFNNIIFGFNLIALFLSNKISVLKKDDKESKVCKVIKNGDCKSLTKSTKFLGLFEYDQVGIIYFLFFCSIPVYSNYFEAGGVLTVISSLAVLFPFYSIFYQQYVAKSWCIICLSIQGCIVINFLFFFTERTSFEYSLISFYNFFIPIVILLLITNFYFLASHYKNKFENATKRLNKFIGNDDIFSSLSYQNALETKITKASSIIIGDEKVMEISLITNPFCGYCQEAYIEVKEVISYNENYALKIIYLDSNNHEAKDICLQFISIFFLNGEKAYLASVEAWYRWGIKDHQKWRNRFYVEKYELAEKILIENKKWADQNDINETPIFLINNAHLPIEYEIGDLKYV